MALDVCIVAFPQTGASTVYGIHDILSTVGPEWALLRGEQPGPPLIRSRIVASNKDVIKCVNDGVIQPHAEFSEIESTDIVCIPEVVI